MAVGERGFMKFAFTDLSRDDGEVLTLGWKHLFVTLWREVCTLIRANLCFLLFCLPVVTIPAALTALHGICVDAVRGQKCRVMRIYLKTIRQQFFQSWGVFLVLAALEFVSAFGAWFYFRQGNIVTGILGLFMTAAAVVALLMIPYSFCMIARVDLPMKKVLKNAFLLVFLNLRFSVCGGVLCLALTMAQLLWWLYLIPLILLIGLSLTAYIGTYFSLFGLQKYVLTEEL